MIFDFFNTAFYWIMSYVIQSGSLHWLHLCIKVFPTKPVDQLRNISGLLNLNKVIEKIISKMMISDMKHKIDPAQFANQKGLSIQHYLVKMIDKILQSVDTNSKSESVAVLASLVDWKQAFPRQCPKLGVESFIQNGVRPSLIPLIISYFQDRKMKVKWHSKLSSTKDLPGGGPKGQLLGFGNTFPNLMTMLIV